MLFTVTFLEYSLFSVTQWDVYNCYTHFIAEETEAKGHGFCTKFHLMALS